MHYSVTMSSHPKTASADHPIVPLLAERWSPYAFAPQPVEEEKLLSCLEAARWAASSYNEQPWVFLIARREHAPEFRQMLACLVEANQEWAQHAGVLLLTVAARQFSRNAKPNRMAEHDVGLAAGNLSVQATALGLAVHQMAGINPSKARQAYGIPDTHDPLTAIAMGYAVVPPGDHSFARRDQTPRSRKPLQDFVFRGRWGQTGV